MLIFLVAKVCLQLLFIQLLVQNSSVILTVKTSTYKVVSK